MLIVRTTFNSTVVKPLRGCLICGHASSSYTFVLFGFLQSSHNDDCLISSPMNS